MPVRFCDRLKDDGQTCNRRFHDLRLLREHKRYVHGRAPLVTPNTGLLALAAAADDAVPPVPPPQPDPRWDWSTASLPTAAPYMHLADVPSPETAAYLCTQHVAGDGSCTAGCFAVVVPFKDSTQYHLQSDSAIRAKFGPCVEQDRSLTAIIRYGDPDANHVERARTVLTDTLKTKLCTLTREVPKESPLTVDDFISGQFQWDLTRPLQLSTDPETWGIKTGAKTNALYQAIVDSGFKNPADVPGGANDYLSQLDTVSEAESEDARNGTQTEHNGATMVMGVAGWDGTCFHNDLFGPGKNLVVGAAGCQLVGTSYVHLLPRMLAIGWYRTLMKDNNDAYFKRLFNDQTPDLVGDSVVPGQIKVSSARFPTPRQLANAHERFGLPIHSHPLPPGSSYSLQPGVDHSFSNHRYIDAFRKLLVKPPKLSITFDWMGVDALKPDAPPLGLPVDFTYLVKTELDDTVKAAFSECTALEIKYSHKPVVFDDTNKAVREVTLLFPSQLYIATSGIPNSGKGMWVSTTVPKGALICEFTGTLVFAQDTPEGKRRAFPPSKILADPHTWRLLEQKEWDPPVDGDPPVDATWFVLAIAAKNRGSGAGYVNSVFWNTGYATDAKAEELFPREVEEYERKIDTYLESKATLKDPKASQKARNHARRDLDKLGGAAHTQRSPSPPV